MTRKDQEEVAKKPDIPYDVSRSKGIKSQQVNTVTIHCCDFNMLQGLPVLKPEDLRLQQMVL